MRLEIPARADALLHDEERGGVDLIDLLLQRLQLVLRHADAQHLHRLARVGALSRPAGQAAVEPVQNRLKRLDVHHLG